MTGDEPEFDLRSFGRRRGRKPSERQARLLREVLPRVAVDLTSPLASPPPHPALSPRREGHHGLASPLGERRARSAGEGAVDRDNLRQPTPSPRPSPQAPRPSPQGERKIWLEIGFGGGEHLLYQAVRNPDVTIIGCEPFEDGVVKVLTAIEDDALANVRIHMDDARDLLRALPVASIARAFILFPDPWPKRKHVKRRLVNTATLALLARVLRPCGELRIATDIGDYARTMLEAFRDETRLVWQVDAPSDWRVRPADWPETRYEAKAARDGRRSYYFRFRRV